jgi:hypothetical protein
MGAASASCRLRQFRAAPGASVRLVLRHLSAIIDG